MATNIFNGAPEIAGYIQAYEGGNALITIGRAKTFDSKTNTWTKNQSIAQAKDGAGFLVSQYRVTFERGSNLQRFLNMKKAVAIVGAGTGRMELTGLVGTLASFNALLTGNVSPNGTGEDLCNPLVVTISDQGIFKACTEGSSVTSPGTIICQNAIIQAINFTGQIDQQGVVMQQATLTAQFTGLSISDKAVTVKDQQ